jgi:hypothetical protein
MNFNWLPFTPSGRILRSFRDTLEHLLELAHNLMKLTIPQISTLVRDPIAVTVHEAERNPI